jgi:hypothetical protein
MNNLAMDEDSCDGIWVYLISFDSDNDGTLTPEEFALHCPGNEDDDNDDDFKHMACIKMGMFMQDPMLLPIAMNMTGGFWIDRPGDNFALKGMSVTENDLGLSLRQYPSDGYKACDVVARISMSMTGTKFEKEKPAILAPTPSPTLVPTKSDTVLVEVSFELVASVPPTAEDKENLKSTLATHLGLDVENLQNFKVEYVEVDEDGNVVAHRSRQLLRKLLSTSYKWIVTFDVVVSLSDTDADSTEELTSDILDSIADDSLEEAIEENVGIEVEVDDSSIAADVVERDTDDTPPTKKKASDDDEVMLGLDAASTGIYAGVFVVVMMLICGGLCYYRKQQAGAALDPMGGVEDGMVMANPPPANKPPVSGAALNINVNDAEKSNDGMTFAARKAKAEENATNRATAL